MKQLAIAACLIAILCPGHASAAAAEVKRCKSYVQGRIDVLDAELHKGEKPDAARKLVERRAKLKEQHARCERNPRAYQKDI